MMTLCPKDSLMSNGQSDDELNECSPFIRNGGYAFLKIRAAQVVVSEPDCITDIAEDLFVDVHFNYKEGYSGPGFGEFDRYDKAIVCGPQLGEIVSIKSGSESNSDTELLLQRYRQTTNGFPQNSVTSDTHQHRGFDSAFAGERPDQIAENKSNSAAREEVTSGRSADSSVSPRKVSFGKRAILSDEAWISRQTSLRTLLRSDDDSAAVPSDTVMPKYVAKASKAVNPQPDICTKKACYPALQNEQSDLQVINPEKAVEMPRFCVGANKNPSQHIAPEKVSPSSVDQNLRKEISTEYGCPNAEHETAVPAASDSVPPDLILSYQSDKFLKSHTNVHLPASASTATQNLSQVNETSRKAGHLQAVTENSQADAISAYLESQPNPNAIERMASSEAYTKQTGPTASNATRKNTSANSAGQKTSSSSMIERSEEASPKKSSEIQPQNVLKKENSVRKVVDALIRVVSRDKLSMRNNASTPPSAPEEESGRPSGQEQFAKKPSLLRRIFSKPHGK